MKLISPHESKIIFRLPLDRVRPLQGFNGDLLKDRVKERYKFTPVDQGAQMGLPVGIPVGGFPVGVVGAPFGSPVGLQRPTILAQGKYLNGTEEIRISQLEISPDCSIFVVSAITTEQGDHVLDDLTELLEQEFGFRDVSKHSLRNYGSSLIVEFDDLLEEMISQFTIIQELVTPLFNSVFGMKEEAKVERLSFGIDPTQIPSSKALFVAPFTIERRAGVEYSENRYFTGAPLKTQTHAALLESIESALRT